MVNGFDAAPRPMAALDPEVLKVIRSSAARLYQHEDAFIEEFRADITTLIPAMAGDGQVFCERMVRSLLWLAITNQPPKVVADTLHWAGARNWIEGFPEQHYTNVANALVRVVRQLSESDQFTSIGSAWVSYFQWAQPYLIAGGRHAAAQHAAAQQAAAQEAAARREAAIEEAARAQALALYPEGRHRDAAGDISLETVAGLLDDEDDEDDEDVGYGQIMVSMTRNQRRDRPERHG
jgi:hypothetical protein